MTRLFWIYLGVMICSATADSLNGREGEGQNNNRPNIVLVMADDLGYSDLGCYGGEIKTPNLDGLATHGLRFSQFYNTGRCWPTRASLLTGYYPQQVRRDDLPGLKKSNRPDWAPLISQRLKDSGYRTYHSGKWHLDGMPIDNGFDRSYYLRDQGRFFNPKVHWEDDIKLPAVKPGSGYYGTTAIADHAVRALVDHQKNHSDKPFFHYIAFTAPHFPLHALPEDMAKYQDVYKSGWDQTRIKRRLRQKELGLVKGMAAKPEPKIGPPYHFPDAFEILGKGEVRFPVEWETLTEQQQIFQQNKMIAHAAMIDRMDQEIGRIIAQMKKMNQWENTLFLFLSDNGASAEIMVRADGHDPLADPGSAKSYLCLGPGWSTCCNTPFRRHKTWTHEGGIRTPFIAHWPAGIKNSMRGSVVTQPAHVIDIVPTLMDLTQSKFELKKESPNWPGVSLLKSLTQSSDVLRRVLWWSHEGNLAIRKGDWKAVTSKDSDWELFDLKSDPAEVQNRASDRKEILEDLKGEWKRMENEFIILHR